MAGNMVSDQAAEMFCGELYVVIPLIYAWLRCIFYFF